MNGLCDGHIDEESECAIVQKMHLAYVFVRLGFRPRKDRQREQASVLRGNPEHVRELIDGCDFARAYTSGVLSFQEPDIADGPSGSEATKCDI